MHTDDRDAYSVPEARTRLGGLSHGKFYQLIASGELKSFTVGRRRLVSHAALVDFIRRREAKPITMQPAPRKKGENHVVEGCTDK
jgi:excisionase family DNA binding protein